MKRKVFGLIILLLIYVVAFFIGFGSFVLTSKVIDSVILNLFIADVVATIFIWIVGLILKTASIYDPYWSVQTVAIFVPLQFMYGFNLGNIIFLVFISLWAIRLTVNFIKTFNDITYLDWRYKSIQEKTKWFYPLVSLLGIHMVPTVIVFMASVPAFMYVIKQINFNFLNLIGLLIMFIGVLLEFFADRDMHKFKEIRTDRSQIINIGLWKYSRHPNYLGEILFWYGVAFTLMFPTTNYWYLILGAVLNTLLFLFISIPLAENHMKNYKPGFDEYKKRTRMLLPIKK